jgi:cytochrome c-type biogenesis protein CcmH/NrfG
LAASQRLNRICGATTHILLGDVLAGLNRPSEALASYHRAMSLLPRSIETPSLLSRRITSVMDPGKK